MSRPLILYKQAYFAAESSAITQDVFPTTPVLMESQNYLGTVLTISGAREYEEAIFETPVNGKWVDRDSVNQRDREVITITLNEVSPYYLLLMEAASGTVAGNGLTATFTPGSQVTHKGWLYYVSRDDHNAKIHEVSRWVKLDLPAWEFPQTGYVNPSFAARVLHSLGAIGAVYLP